MVGTNSNAEFAGINRELYKGSRLWVAAKGGESAWIAKLAKVGRGSLLEIGVAAERRGVSEDGVIKRRLYAEGQRHRRGDILPRRFRWHERWRIKFWNCSSVRLRAKGHPCRFYPVVHSRGQIGPDPSRVPELVRPGRQLEVNRAVSKADEDGLGRSDPARVRGVRVLSPREA